jgi:RND superfamily putative drug exporter
MVLPTVIATPGDRGGVGLSMPNDEIHAGLKTGIIGSMAGTGGVVTSAGLVFEYSPPPWRG